MTARLRWAARGAAGSAARAPTHEPSLRDVTLFGLKSTVP